MGKCHHLGQLVLSDMFYNINLYYFAYSAQPGPSRLAPPTPTTEDVTPLIPTDHSRTVAPSYTPVTVSQGNVQQVTEFKLG